MSVGRETPAAPAARPNRWKMAGEVLINLVLPYFIYVFAQPRLGDVHALMASSAPPVLWSILEFLRNRRIDALSLLVLAGIAGSLFAFIGSGSVRLLQLRENLVTVLFGVVFLGSAAIGRPVIYHIARAAFARNNSAEAQRFDALREDRYFKASMTIITVVWGAGLLAGAAVAVVLVFALPIAAYLVAGPIANYAVMGALGLWTFWFARRRRREGEARRAQAAALETGN